MGLLKNFLILRVFFSLFIAFGTETQARCDITDGHTFQSFLEKGFPCDCYRQNDGGVTYRGIISKTESGRECQNWSSQIPHEHTRTPGNFQEAGLEKNYCRNPDREERPWCYTTDPFKRWEHCSVPICSNATAPVESLATPLIRALTTQVMPMSGETEEIASQQSVSSDETTSSLEDVTDIDSTQFSNDSMQSQFASSNATFETKTVEAEFTIISNFPSPSEPLTTPALKSRTMTVSTAAQATTSPREMPSSIMRIISTPEVRVMIQDPTNITTTDSSLLVRESVSMINFSSQKVTETTAMITNGRISSRKNTFKDAVCFGRGAAYECKCKSEFFKKIKQFSQSMISANCDCHRCHAKAICEPHGDGTSRCQCPKGYRGDGKKRCQITTSTDVPKTRIASSTTQTTEKGLPSETMSSLDKTLSSTKISRETESTLTSDLPVLLTNPIISSTLSPVLTEVTATKGISLCDNSYCHENAICSVKGNSYHCRCKDGYQGDGRMRCRPVAPLFCCCDVNAYHVHRGGRCVCKCRPGFYGNGKVCRAPDPCRLIDCPFLTECSDGKCCSIFLRWPCW